jgi:hypothetical protein
MAFSRRITRGLAALNGREPAQERRSGSVYRARVEGRVVGAGARVQSHGGAAADVAGRDL